MQKSFFFNVLHNFYYAQIVLLNDSIFIYIQGANKYVIHIYRGIIVEIITSNIVEFLNIFSKKYLHKQCITLYKQQIYCFQNINNGKSIIHYTNQGDSYYSKHNPHLKLINGKGLQMAEEFIFQQKESCFQRKHNLVTIADSCSGDGDPLLSILPDISE